MDWAVIMAGGAGTRFWPASRLERPKQLLSFGGSESLLEATVSRIAKAIPHQRIIILTQEKQVKAIKKILPKIPQKNYVIEPVGRNTAPAIGLAAHIINKRDPKAVMACFPSDHIINKPAQFVKALKVAFAEARKGEKHLTFGIVAKSPETGFGYIERAKLDKKTKGFSVYKVKRFTEKPSLARAKQFVKTKKYYWNSGMFVWKADWLIDSFATLQPKMNNQLKKITEHYGKAAWKKTLSNSYPKINSISIDYAIMERAKNVCVIPIDCGWSDLGSWTSFSEMWPKDKQGNASPQGVLAINSHENIVQGNKKLVALVGVNDLVVIESEDAILVTHKDYVQDIRKVTDELKRKKMNKYL